MEQILRTTHTIDASGKRLGRLAVDIALLLRGKRKAEFALHKDVGDFVRVENVGAVRLSGRKWGQKKYRRHSGYLGSLREKTAASLFKERPGEVLRRAVWGMLPKNKLRSKYISRLSMK